MEVNKEAYAKALYERRAEGVIPRQANVSLGSWTPRENECHANAAVWCKYAAGFSVVRGWLYFDYFDAYPYVHFNAHSVVRNPEGELVDITPSRASRRYPFIVALEPAAEYNSLVCGALVRLTHVKS